MFVLNAFSLNMLDVPEGENVGVEFRRISAERARYVVSSHAEWQNDQLISAVGHEDTAAIFSEVLGINIPARRIDVKFVIDEYDHYLAEEGRGARRDYALLGQYKGPRLPEGTKTLPEGATIEWYMVFLKEPAPAVPDRY